MPVILTLSPRYLAAPLWRMPTRRDHSTGCDRFPSDGVHGRRTSHLRAQMAAWRPRSDVRGGSTLGPGRYARRAPALPLLGPQVCARLRPYNAGRDRVMWPRPRLICDMPTCLPRTRSELLSVCPSYRDAKKRNATAPSQTTAIATSSSTDGCSRSKSCRHPPCATIDSSGAGVIGAPAIGIQDRGCGRAHRRAVGRGRHARRS